VRTNVVRSVPFVGWKTRHCSRQIWCDVRAVLSLSVQVFLGGSSNVFHLYYQLRVSHRDNGSRTRDVGPQKYVDARRPLRCIIFGVFQLVASFLNLATRACAITQMHRSFFQVHENSIRSAFFANLKVNFLFQWKRTRKESAVPPFVASWLELLGLLQLLGIILLSNYSNSSSGPIKPDPSSRSSLTYSPTTSQLKPI
jgi:hypothetical protein